MSRSLSLRAILTITVASLTLLLSLIAAHQAYTEWRRWEAIHALKGASAISQSFFNIIEQLARERELAVALLAADDAETTRSLAHGLAESRRLADGELTRIEAALRTTMPGTTLVDYRQQQAQWLTLREETDRMLALPLAQRDPNASAHWFDGSTRFIGHSYDLWMGYTRLFTEIDPIVTQRFMFQHFLGLIIRYSGRERAMISGLIVADRPITPAERGELLRWRGVIEQGWEMCARLSERSRLAPAVSPLLREAHSHYVTVYDMVEDLFYIPGTTPSTPYPLAVDLWLDVSANATDSLNAVKEEALQQTQNYADMLERRATHAIIFHLSVLVLALVLCAYSFWIVNRRVIGPVRRMIQALLDTSEGKPLTHVPLPGNAQDEIGQLGQVLYRFQQNTALIRESQERYRALIESSSQIVWVWKEGEIEKQSPLSVWWEETTGSPSEIIATWGWLDLVHPDDRALAQQVWGDALGKGKTFDLEYRLRSKNGGWRYVAIRGVPLMGADGSVREFIGSLNDITARKEAEAGELRYMRDLERSNKELDDFAYIASHDLKEPLRGLHNHARFLLEDNEGKLEKDSTDRLHRLLYLSQRMEKLVNDLLYFSRLGRQQLAIQPTDLNEVVHDIETMIDVFMHERNARIIIPTELPTLVCDKPRITEALRNLITNAIKYNNKPEKIVEIGFQAQHATPDGKNMQNVLYVKDNGVGIAPEFHEEIFRIFKRLQNSKDVEDGTGVGLTFVKKIIERHGGKIWLESTPGEGTIFYFTLGRLSDDTR